jgi:hypothetical protein
MKWILGYLSPLKLRLTVGITVKVIGTVAELMIPFIQGCRARSTL